MRKKLQLILPIIVALGVLVLLAFVSRGKLAVLDPAGPIAARQMQLLVAATVIMLLIVVPVFGLTIYIAWKYRASNTKAEYRPDWDHDRRLESLWWGFPCLIILVLATIAWTTSHSLDPSKALASQKQPLTIQVVALQYKWLFIYPEQQIATINYVQFPAGTPVNFQITADAPMNSFWIPRLGGQIYAMAGMTTQLHLMADQPGSYHGSSANLSGNGFAAMRFTAESSLPTDFNQWILRTKSGSGSLDLGSYTALTRPSVPASSITYASAEPGLFDMINMKYMKPGGTMPSMDTRHAEGMAH